MGLRSRARTGRDRQLERFLGRQGRYYLPRREYWHHVLAEFFLGMGFVVVSVERLDTHPLWQARVNLTADAQYFLLLGLACSHPFVLDLLGRQLRVAISRFLRQQGQRVLAQDVVVVRCGQRVQVVFPWRRGYAGIWKPQRADPWRVSLVLRRWLRLQVN